MKLLLFALLGSLFMAYRVLGSSWLDGSAWEVKVRRRTLLAFSKKDTLVFERGKFTSARYLSSGYLPSGYFVRKLDEQHARFEVSQIREDGSVVDWRGDIRGDRMKGRIVWTRKDGRSRSYSFKGRRASDPPRLSWLPGWASFRSRR